MEDIRITYSRGANKVSPSACILQHAIARDCKMYYYILQHAMVITGMARQVGEGGVGFRITVRMEGLVLQGKFELSQLYCTIIVIQLGLEKKVAAVVQSVVETLDSQAYGQEFKSGLCSFITLFFRTFFPKISKFFCRIYSIGKGLPAAGSVATALLKISGPAHRVNELNGCQDAQMRAAPAVSMEKTRRQGFLRLVCTQN